jgi:hypothetical protein
LRTWRDPDQVDEPPFIFIRISFLYLSYFIRAERARGRVSPPSKRR